LRTIVEQQQQQQNIHSSTTAPQDHCIFLCSPKRNSSLSTINRSCGVVAKTAIVENLHLLMERSTVDCVSQGNGAIKDHHCRQQQTEAPLLMTKKA
jgi:hypothetical protein